MNPAIRIPERNKRDGVCYAVTNDGIELPVIDLTHPAFSHVPDRAALDRAVAEYLDITARQERMPAVVRKAMLWLLGRRSRLVRAINSSGKSFLPGLDTYLIKLGPDNLGDGYASRIDRAVARGLPCLSARLRLRHTATLIAEALAPALQARPGATLRLINIAGGPAMDSVNALLLLERDHPALLQGREVVIDDLDVDDAGPAFGARALAALLADGAPLAGVHASMDRFYYDWSDSGSLLERPWHLDGAIVACSSEGGLFEYGDDEVVVGNLDALRRLAPGAVCLAGSVTKEGPLARALDRMRMTRVTHPRTAEAFSALAARGGWAVDRVIDNLMTLDVRLRPVA